jgi:dCMP deaminase
MTNWDMRFMGLAEHIAQWSKDPSTKVGAVIVDSERRVLGHGYNGFPRGIADSADRLLAREVKYKMVVHAEANAVLNAGVPLRGSILYTWPLPPCADCAKLIIQAGIVAVRFPEWIPVPDNWRESWAWASAMLEEAGVNVRAVSR